MTMIGKPFGYRIEKFCFVACPPETCDCGAYDPFCADSPLFMGFELKNEAEKKVPITIVKEEDTDG